MFFSLHIFFKIDKGYYWQSEIAKKVQYFRIGLFAQWAKKALAK